MNLLDFINTTSYYTDPDDSIKSTGARDPLGFESIWSHLGREIFHNKITSIANDVRNYTITLLHHSVVRELKENGVFSIIKKLQGKILNREISDANVLTALLIFLENLMIYSVVKRDDTGIDVKTEGIIGSSKGLTAEFSDIKISLGKDAHILVNQANVGLSARYKTPFMKMGIFNEQYEYSFNRNNYPDPWNQFESLDTNVTRLRDTLVGLIRNLVEKDSSLAVNLKAPNGAVNTIVNMYRTIFHNPSVHTNIGQFWKTHLGFEKAPAKYIYNSMNEVKSNDDKIPYEEVVKQAMKQAGSEKEEESRKKYQAILDTEKLIAPVRYVFDVLLSGQYGRLANTLLDRVGSTINALNNTATSDITHYFDTASPYVKDRVTRLGTLVINQHDPNEFINGLLSYHSRIVEERKNAPWIRREGDELKIISGMRGKEPGQVYSWYHSYYMDSLRNIINGMNPEKEN